MAIWNLPVRSTVADARSQILGRIRAALADVPAPERVGDVPVVRDYRRADRRPHDELVTLFAQRVSDYRARVRRVSPRELPEAIAEACARPALRRVAVPLGLPDGWLAPGPPERWLPAGGQLIRDQGLTATELDRVDGAITGCAAAIAETGTIVLDGGALSGRRALTLVPDHHICVVAAGQIHGQIAEALAAVAPAVIERRAPITLVSGPSATSDIELERVEGVHGPRNLTVLIVDDGRGPRE
jgi:L-lactate dehydrogenase complex protein LldG